jgi:hypothetical protein
MLPILLGGFLVYEIVQHVTAVRVVVLLLNLGIFVTGPTTITAGSLSIVPARNSVWRIGRGGVQRRHIGHVIQPDPGNGGAGRKRIIRPRRM